MRDEYKKVQEEIEMESYSTLDMQSIMRKKSKTISSEEALKDVIPIPWKDSLFSSDTKVIGGEKARK